MKTYETDALNRKEFGDLLYGLLQSEFILTDESYVVALTGGFGAGKSHFLEMWETAIRANADAPIIVHVNAWESDHSGEPILAIVSAITKQLNGNNSFSQKSISTLKSAAARVVRGGASLAKDLALGYVKSKTGVEIDNAVEAIKEDHSSNGLNKSAMKIFEQYEARCDAISDLKKALQEIVSDTTSLKMILVIDELDRCRPTYAIDFLESLKHIFNIKGMAVLLAVDWEQLSCTAAALFGQNLNTEEYFRKFVTRKVALPAPGFSELNKLIQKLWDRLIHSESLIKNNRFSYAPKIAGFGNIPAAIIFGSGVTRPRQVEEVFRILSHYLYTELDQSGTIEDSTFLSLLFLLTINTVNPILFDQIADGNASVERLLEIVLRITRKNITKINWNSESTESMLIDAFIDRNSAEEFQKKYFAKMSHEEMEARSKRHGALPYFSTTWPESEMQGLARKLRSLKRFSE